MQVLPSAGGWHRVIDCFEEDHAEAMRSNTNRFMVLLIDCDGLEDRLEQVRARIPSELADRVFVLGTLSEPEELKKALGKSYESIGSELAKDCQDGSDDMWCHTLLIHNANEVLRLREHVHPILFA